MKHFGSGQMAALFLLCAFVGFEPNVQGDQKPAVKSPSISVLDSNLSNGQPMLERSVNLPENRVLRVISIGADPLYQNMLGMRTNGWLGSDVAESVVLSAKKTLWLFGDTFIGALSNGVRVAGASMIHSTIGIQDRTKKPPACMAFYWKQKDGKPESFFPHQRSTPGSYYWVTKGVMLRGQLFLFAWCITDTHDAVGWKEVGSVLIRVPNPLDAPDQWRQEAYTLKLKKGDTFLSALLVEEPYLYLFGIIKPRQTALARIRIDDLVNGKLVEAYEYWVNGPKGLHWGSEPRNCVPQFLPVNSECTVYYESAWKLFTCFTYDVSTPEIYLTTAERIYGPWTKPVPIYRVPEHRDVSLPIVSYAVRQHPELSTKPGEIILTYDTNVRGSPAPLFTEEGKHIYVPKFLRVELKLDQNPAKTNAP